MSAIAHNPRLAERSPRGGRRLFLALGAVVLLTGAGIAVWTATRSHLDTGVPTSPVSSVSTGGGETWVVTRLGDRQQLWSNATGDRRWLRVTPPQVEGAAELGDRQILDRLHGWVAISDGLRYDYLKGIARTTDGGRTWLSSAPPGCSRCQFDSLTFFDAKRGYLAVYADESAESMKLFSTSDGGATWSLVTRSSRAADTTWVDPQHGLYDRVLMSPGGYVGGDELSRTSDGGRTWAPVALDGKRSYPGLIGGVGSVDGTLVIPAFAHHTKPVVYTSSDGGAHWQVHSAPPTANVADCCLFPQGFLFNAVSSHTWVTSDASWRHLFETSDSGKSWRVVNLPRAFWNPGGSDGYGMAETPPQVDFSSAKVGWAIVRYSELLRTTDGGRHWTRASRPAPKRDGHR